LGEPKSVGSKTAIKGRMIIQHWKNAFPSLSRSNAPLIRLLFNAVLSKGALRVAARGHGNIFCKTGAAGAVLFFVMNICFIYGQGFIFLLL
jgi:hypothetical protein